MVVGILGPPGAPTTRRMGELVVGPSNTSVGAMEVIGIFPAVMDGLNPGLSEVDKILLDYKFSIPSYQKIMEFMTQIYKKEGKVDGKKISNGLPSELLKSFDSCYLFPLPGFNNEEKYLDELEKMANELFEINIKDKRKEISQKIKENEENEEMIEKLNKEYSRLTALLPKS